VPRMPARPGRGLAALGVALIVLMGLPAIAAAKPGYGPKQFVDRQLAGGEPLVMYDPVHKSYIYTAHEGTTHLYKPGLNSPFEFVANYRNQVNIWYSKNHGKSWTRDDYSGTGFQTPPAQNQGFSDPDLTEDAGGRVYNTGIDLANDALFSTGDGGVNWDRGTTQCHDGDRPWLAGANRDEVYMATDAQEGSLQGSGHEIFKSSDGGNTCSATGIPDFGSTAGGGSYSGYGKLYWNPRVHKLVEPALFMDGNGNQTGIGASFWSPGQSKFTPVKVANSKVFAHFPITIFDRSNRLYLIWDTDARQPGTKGGCDGAPTPATNEIRMAVSKDFGNTWSASRSIASFKGKRVFWPWAVAGNRGELSVVYYVADRLADLDCQDSSVSIGEARITGADTSSPTIVRQDVSRGPIHRASTVCQGGTTCVATGQDRRLGDFFTNATDENGCVMIASGDTTVPSTQTGGPRPTSLPIIIRQTSGAGLTGRDCKTGKPLSCRDRIRPSSRVTALKRSRRGIDARGRARDRGCHHKVQTVYISIARHQRGGHDRCRYLKRNGRLTRATSCHRGRYLRAKGTGHWRIRIRGKLPAGRWEIRARARDRAHNRERGRTRRNTKRFRIH
jgi:hypothetical protein